MSRFLRVIVFVTLLLTIFYFGVNYLVPEFFQFLSGTLVLLTPFIAALVFGLFMEPAIKLLVERTRLSRTAAVGLTMLAFFGTIGLVASLLIIKLAAELVALSVALPRYVVPVQEFIEKTITQGKFYYLQLPPEITSRINENLVSLTGQVSNSASALGTTLLHFASALPGTVLGTIVTLLATYFFSRDRHLMVRFWLKVLPAPWGERTLNISREISWAFMSYVRAQSVLISLTTVQAMAGLYIIGADYFLTMGLLVGLLDVLPVLGPAAIFVPWAIWSIITANYFFALKLIILYLLIWLVRQTLEARVVAANLGLHPLAVLAAMYIGLKLLGVVGLILGPILLIAAQAGIKAVSDSKTGGC